MHQQHSTTLRKQRGQEPPIVAELRAIFDTLPDGDLLAMLQRCGRGRGGYNPKILWRCYVAHYVLGIESVSALIRLLHTNPYIAATCARIAREREKMRSCLRSVPCQAHLSRMRLEKFLEALNK
jgi:hypothetical protein